MSFPAIVVLAFSMSADAFAAALGRGATLDRPSIAEALRCGLIFGAVEGVMPVIGWGLGTAASGFVGAIDRWIALALLSVIGGKMAWDGLRRPAQADRPKRHSSRILMMTAIGTSIDALTVGATLALLEIGIVAPAAAIGMATMTMTTLGIMLGRLIGARFGRAAEILGGVALFAIGLKIALSG